MEMFLESGWDGAFGFWELLAVLPAYVKGV